MESCRRRPPSCRPHPLEGKPGLRALVSRFRRDHAPGVRSESEFFRTLPSMDPAIHHVALAVDEHGRCYDHQFRIRRAARPRAKAILTASTTRLCTCTSFNELHTLLEALLLPVRGRRALRIRRCAAPRGTPRACAHIRVSACRYTTRREGPRPWARSCIPRDA